jgi:hypothetical protein
MKTPADMDRRLRDRRGRQPGPTRAEVEAATAALPDLEKGVRKVEDAEVEKFRADFEREAELRGERIVRARQRASQPPQPTVRPPVKPFDDTEI